MSFAYNIELFQEQKPMGTAGSNSLQKGKICNTLFFQLWYKKWGLTK
jgi:hypothetical protein